MFVLDTSIVSDLQKRRQPVVDWISGKTSEQLYISVLTLGEIARGVAMKARRDPLSAEALERWLERTRTAFADRVLHVSEDIAIEWGKLSSIRTRGDADGLIAATAAIHGFVLVTRNVSHFSDAGLTLINPWTI
ncbi:type II toxin-antitoxin system VapC family toxin [Mesorhizobium sp. CAU 1732]|uniref:type II toxin-antitoxin system VapC family toxin n=1 Tax=Mesorhizobium sp. CAU 1732 TaxID=3140358 RepID=UPI003260949C